VGLGRRPEVVVRFLGRPEGPERCSPASGDETDIVTRKAERRGPKVGNRPSLEMVVPAGALSEGGSHDCPTFSFRGAFKKPKPAVERRREGGAECRRLGTRSSHYR